MHTIGFIGLGLMGSAMVERLQARGHAVMVMGHRDRRGIEAALARGATEATSPRAMAETCDVVMLCMGTSDQVEARMRGPEGVIAGLSAGKAVIDFGTSLPGSTVALAAEVAEKGAVMLDAPLGRTPAHAREGKLNIMCAGDRPTFDRLRPLLDDLGENVFHLGPVGTGHRIKLINNAFGMTVANAMAEAFAVADRTGIDRKALYEVMAAGPLRSGMMDFVKGYAVDGIPDQLAFSIRNALKDVGYYIEMTRDSGTEATMPRCAHAALQAAERDGRGDDMVSQMVDFFAAAGKAGA